MRKAKFEDAPKIEMLIAPYVADFITQPDAKLKFEAEYLSSLISNPEIDYFVEENEQNMIAVIAFKGNHLLHFFVDQALHSQGLGRRLWDNALIKLKLNKFDAITVNSSLYAVPIYLKFGFEEIGTIEEWGGIRFIKMQRKNNI